LLHVAAARARGLERVLVAEPNRARRALAVAWGAQEHRGGTAVDVAMVCTPAPAAIAAGAAALDAGGTLCLYAPTAPGVPLPVEGWDVFSRELRVTASWSAGPAEMREALALLRTGAVRWRELITAQFDLDGTGDALSVQRSGAALKAVVRP
jgi:L-iditol 2-dehydrogenase